jgi:hypothetical protein
VSVDLAFDTTIAALIAENARAGISAGDALPVRASLRTVAEVTVVTAVIVQAVSTNVAHFVA